MIPHLILVGGFLGAGKTTLVAQMVQRLAAHNLRVGVVTNDQAADLVDTRYLDTLHTPGPRVREVAGGCFCCCFNDFMARLTDLQHETPADVLIGEPVGSCIDLAATVVRPLQQLYADFFRTAPYSVLVDPLRWRQSRSFADWPLPQQTLYIYRLQIDEADAILLNKTDLLTGQERETLIQELSRTYPGRPIFVISALTGEGIDLWLSHVLPHSSSGDARAGTRHIDVDYDRYAQGEAELGWLNLTAKLANTSPEDWPTFCAQLLSSLRETFQMRSIEIAHAKLLLTAGKKYVLGNLSASASAPVVRGSLPADVREISLTLNLRAAAAPEAIEPLTLSVLQRALPPTVSFALLHHACFRPGRPVPTHHLD